MVKPGGYVRIFVDGGAPMAQLLSEAAAQGMMPDYAGKLLAAFEAEAQPVLANHRISPGKRKGASNLPPTPSAWDLLEPLSQRELEVLRLVAQELSNREISRRLFRALSMVKGHNRIIFDKLQIKSRTEAVAHARELGLL